MMERFRAFLRNLWSETHGQDLAEYCLLTALAALIGLGIFLYLSGGVQAIWTGANTQLVAGNAAAQPASNSGVAH